MRKLCLTRLGRRCSGALAGHVGGRRCDCHMVLGFGTLALISVFMRPLEAEFGWSRTEISLAYAIATVGMALGGLAWGRLTDRVNLRIPLTIGGWRRIGAAVIRHGWRAFVAGDVSGTPGAQWVRLRRALCAGSFAAFMCCTCMGIPPVHFDELRRHDLRLGNSRRHKPAGRDAVWRARAYLFRRFR